MAVFAKHGFMLHRKFDPVVGVVHFILQTLSWQLTFS